MLHSQESTGVFCPLRDILCFGLCVLFVVISIQSTTMLSTSIKSEYTCTRWPNDSPSMYIVNRSVCLCPCVCVCVPKHALCAFMCIFVCVNVYSLHLGFISFNTLSSIPRLGSMCQNIMIPRPCGVGEREEEGKATFKKVIFRSSSRKCQGDRRKPSSLWDNFIPQNYTRMKMNCPEKL